MKTVNVNHEKNVLKIVYGYISFAFVGIVMQMLGLFGPIPGILACVWLLIACYYIGKYGNLS